MVSSALDVRVLWCVCSLVRKAYLELALVCFGSCDQVRLVSYGSLLPLTEEDLPSEASLTKVSCIIIIVIIIIVINSAKEDI